MRGGVPATAVGGGIEGGVAGEAGVGCDGKRVADAGVFACAGGSGAGDQAGGRGSVDICADAGGQARAAVQDVQVSLDVRERGAAVGGVSGAKPTPDGSD